jgi:predicted secreted protein
LLDVETDTPFDVELGSAPTTGYAWELRSLPEGVELLGSDFSLPADAAPGDGGVQVFHVRTTRPGHFELPFVLKRRWESEGIEARVIEVESRPRGG